MNRFDHCTHPDQTWCDCDWCRVVRAEAQHTPVPARPVGDLEYPRQQLNLITAALRPH